MIEAQDVVLRVGVDRRREGRDRRNMSRLLNQSLLRGRVLLKLGQEVVRSYSRGRRLV